MRTYRTEIVIPDDRYIALQLPPDLPPGRAVVTVVVEATDLPDASPLEADPDRDDVEWWEEFGDEPPPE